MISLLEKAGDFTACLEHRREMRQNDFTQSNHEVSQRGLTSCILYLVVRRAWERNGSRTPPRL